MIRRVASAQGSRGVACLGALAATCAVQIFAQSAVSIRFDDGLVSLLVRDASLSTVLAEWERVGGSKVVNTERLASEPLTFELTNVREREALGILLRSVPGYVATQRSLQLADRSSFDRIVILQMSDQVRQPHAPSSVSAISSADSQQLLLKLREVAERESARREAAARAAGVAQ